MNLEPYASYFWQGEKIRLRPFRAEDAPNKWREWTDTEARRFLESQTDLPPVSLAEYTEQMRAGADFRDRSPDRIGFAVETLAGEFVGWINLFIGEPGDTVRLALAWASFGNTNAKGMPAKRSASSCAMASTSCAATSATRPAWPKRLGLGRDAPQAGFPRGGPSAGDLLYRRAIPQTSSSLGCSRKSTTPWSDGRRAERAWSGNVPRGGMGGHRGLTGRQEPE